MEWVHREHAAWLDVGCEFRRVGLDMDGNADALTRAITKWGEELAQLRLRDPEPAQATSAFRRRRSAYVGRYERGTYPEASQASAKVGRNEPCPCGSGRKSKRCCGR